MENSSSGTVRGKALASNRADCENACAKFGGSYSRGCYVRLESTRRSERTILDKPNTLDDVDQKQKIVALCRVTILRRILAKLNLFLEFSCNN
jgi:hypothetical protein